jgi:hypothetical protein
VLKRFTLIAALALLVSGENVSFSAETLKRARLQPGPVQVAKFDSKPVIAQLPDGVLMAVFLRAKETGQELTARVSKDNGFTWREEKTLLKLPSEPGQWGGLAVLVDQKGEIHIFTLNDARTSRLPMGQRRLDIWHTKTEMQRARWQPLKRIWQGYTGSLNSVIQLRNGRILLPFSYYTGRSWSNRGEGSLAFTYMGFYDSTLIYSDDDGDSWKLSPSALHVPAVDITSTESGAVEPVALELKDGRIWMLIRTQRGRLYEAFSSNGGISWSNPRPSRFLSSESPVALARLPNDRILILWNNCLRFPYAYGGRHVLHAAISEDEGNTWRGYREVARDPLIEEPPPTRGDFGTAYPFATTTKDGKVIFTAGQGSSARLLCLLLDPAWLYETVQRDDFANGLVGWLSFGTRGVRRLPHPEKAGAHILSIQKADTDWPAATVWNFPFGIRGRMSLKLLLKSGFGGLRIGLTDHFSVPYDPEDFLYNLYNLEIDKDGRLACGEKLDLDRWYDLRLEWDVAQCKAHVFLDNREVAALPLLRKAEGCCYLRISTTAEEKNDAGVLVEYVEVDVSA